jgi:hypothetical protein
MRDANRIFSVSFYIFVCGLSGCTIFFPHYFVNGLIFEREIEHEVCVMSFLQLLSQTFVILNRIQ